MFFNIIWFLGFVFYLGETIIHPGVFRLNPIIPITVVYVLGLLLILQLKQNIKKNNIYLFNTKILRIFSPISFLGYIFLYILDESNYPNYIYSKLHVYLPNFLYLNLYIGLLFLLKFINIFLSRKQKDFTENLIWYLKIFSIQKIPILFVLLILFWNLVSIRMEFVNELKLTLKNINSTYDEKMTARWGKFYDYMLFVKSVTNDTDTINHPSSVSYYVDEANQEILRYFLFPRKLVYDYTSDLSEVKYILVVGLNEPIIVNGKLIYSWPYEKIDGETMLLGGENFERYDPENKELLNRKGLIKL